ncbi:unnamed protein product [Closterium sp. NIES-65]|nr:unnamed protein product [Closterium sp. NIES-65]
MLHSSKFPLHILWLPLSLPHHPCRLPCRPPDSVYAVACSPLPGGRVASGGGDDVAYLWTIGQAEDPVKLEGHRDSIAAVEFSGDGRWVATAGMDGVVMLWDADTGYRRHRLEGPGEAIEVRMAATARHGPRPRPRLPLPCSPQRCLVIALVAVPAVGGRSSLTFLSTHILPFPDVASTGSGGTGGVGGSNSVDVECGDGGVHGRLHRAQRRGHLWGLLARWYAILLPLLFMPALWCGRGRAVWTGSTDGSVRCWDPRSAATTATLQGPLFHSDAITCLAMAPQGAVGAAGSSDHTTALFGLHQPKVLGKLEGHTDSVEAVVFNPLGPTVATASLDGSVRIFDINSLQLRSTCTHQHCTVPSPSYLFTPLPTRPSPLCRLCGHRQDEVVQMAWAPAAPLLVTATADGAVHVWDARTGAIQRTLRGNRDAVVSLALTP